MLNDTAWVTGRSQWEPLCLILLRLAWPHSVYIGRGQQSLGPYACGALETYVRDGNVTLNDQAWIAADGVWRPLGDLIIANLA